MKVDGQYMRCTGFAQQLHIDGKYFTNVYVVGRLRSKRAHMLLSDSCFPVINGQFAYLTDARVVDARPCGDIEYELTLLERIPLIEGGEGNI